MTLISKIRYPRCRSDWDSSQRTDSFVFCPSTINDLIIRERNVSRLHTSLAPTELIDIGFVRGGEVEAEAPPLNTHFELHFKRRIPAGDECITTDTFCYSPLIDCFDCSKNILHHSGVI